MSRVVDAILAAGLVLFTAVLVAALVLGWLASGVKGSEHAVDPSGEPSGERAEPCMEECPGWVVQR